jgi:hypothetical protein
MSAQFMSLSQVAEPVQDIQDIVLDAEDEVMKMLESALGPMTNLLDKKFKEKMSQKALVQIIKGVVGSTLHAVDAYTLENEKKVLQTLEENGVFGKKEKRAGKLSGYTFFTKQMHQDKKEEFKSKGLKGADVTKEIGAMWKKLSDEKKAEYNEMAKKENEENPVSSRKGSRKGSSKGSRKGSSKTDKEAHKCCFVISKGERKGEMCGTSVRSDEPTFEGQWLCSKHATAEKKKVESNKNKKSSKKGEKKQKKTEEEDEVEDEEEEKSSKKEKKEKKEKKQKKTEEDEEEEKSKSKQPKKVEKKKSEKEEEKSKKKSAKKVEEIQDIEDLDEEELDEEEQRYKVLDDMCISWEEDKDNCVVNAKMTKKSLEKLIGKKLTVSEYDVTLSATKSSLIVKYEEDDEEEMKSIKMDKMTDDLKQVHKYINSLDEE